MGSGVLEVVIVGPEDARGEEQATGERQVRLVGLLGMDLGLGYCERRRRELKRKTT